MGKVCLTSKSWMHCASSTGTKSTWWLGWSEANIDHCLSLSSASITRCIKNEKHLKTEVIDKRNRGMLIKRAMKDDDVWRQLHVCVCLTRWQSGALSSSSVRCVLGWPCLRQPLSSSLPAPCSLITTYSCGTCILDDETHLTFLSVP